MRSLDFKIYFLKSHYRLVLLKFMFQTPFYFGSFEPGHNDIQKKLTSSFKDNKWEISALFSMKDPHVYVWTRFNFSSIKTYFIKLQLFYSFVNLKFYSDFSYWCKNNIYLMLLV